MFDTFCPRCGKQLRRDFNGKVIYLRSYECGSFGSLADEKEFTQSPECMQRQIKLLQTRLEREQDTVEKLRNVCRNLAVERNKLKDNLSLTTGQLQEARRRYREFQEMF